MVRMKRRSAHRDLILETSAHFGPMVQFAIQGRVAPIRNSLAICPNGRRNFGWRLT
jgi:hypothetical protein